MADNIATHPYGVLHQSRAGSQSISEPQRRALQSLDRGASPALRSAPTMRADIIGHFKPCITEIYLHIDARMADYIRTV